MSDVYQHMELGLRFVKKVLKEKFTEELHTLYGVLDPDAPYDADGFWLDGLGAVYLKPGPSLQEMRKPARVAAFVSIFTPTEDNPLNGQTSIYQISDAGSFAVARLQVAVTLVIEAVSQEEITLDGEVLDTSEILGLRALRYLGALKHTITKWCAFYPEARAAWPINDYPFSGEIQVSPRQGQSESVTVAMAHLEFALEQDLTLPTPQKLIL